jgi:DNA-binding transcriptional MerR regulator
MKTLLILLALSICAMPLCAAPVGVIDTQRVKSDGNEEPLVDAVANCLAGRRPFTLKQLSDALAAWESALKADKTAAETTAAAETAKREAIVKIAEEQPAKLPEEIAKAKQTAKEKELAEIAEKLAELARRKAELEAAAAVKAGTAKKPK